MPKFKQFFIDIDRNVWIRFIGETINGISMMMIMPFFALYLKNKVDSIFLVGIVMAVSPITAMVGSLFGGRLADRVCPKTYDVYLKRRKWIVIIKA